MKRSSNPAPTERFSCLIVDDDPGLAGMFARIVAEEGGEPCVCHTIAAAVARITARPFDIVILDNRLPDGTGYEFHSRSFRSNSATVVAMITGAPELSQAVELTRNGLFDYLTKPVNADDFAALLRRARVRLGRSGIEPGEGSLLGGSGAMRDVARQLEQAAKHLNATVLLLGETGTGKDLAARLLHRLTFSDAVSRAPYVALNCPGVPSEMFEAELFGSEKGAYTGAERRRTGLVEAANGGTLFLDEVAEIPLALQPKLLRFLESREFRSLGTTDTRHFTGRVVAATNRSLAEQVGAGKFRQDLMYRLDVFTIQLPPLREHLEDIPQIAEGLLTQLCDKYQRAKPSLKSEDLNALRSHSFPGNIRELRNLIERSLLRADPETAKLAMDLSWLRGREEMHRPAREEPDSAASTPQDRHLTAIERQEYEMIAGALRSEKGGIRRSAAKLGLTHQALLRRLQKWPELRQAASAWERDRPCQPPN